MNVRAEICSTERSALLAEALRLGGRLRLQVHGESMLPVLWPGDIVEIEECRQSDVRRGDIVLATREGRFFLHRFLDRCPAGGFILRGDSMPKADPVFPPDAFLARLISSDPRHGISGILSPRWSRALGFFLCYCGIMRRLALRLHRRWNGTSENLDRLAPASRGDA